MLGGIPHAHNSFWYDRYNTGQTWRSLHRYLPHAFEGLENPWSQIMTTNLTTTLARRGQEDAQSNLQAVNGGLLDFLVELCMPRIILLCGGKCRRRHVTGRRRRASEYINVIIRRTRVGVQEKGYVSNRLSGNLYSFTSNHSISLLSSRRFESCPRNHRK